MYILDIFRQYKTRNNRITIVKSLIKGLRIDAAQKELYYSAIDTLADEALDAFYKKLQSFVETVEIQKVADRQKTIASHQEPLNAQNNANMDLLLSTMA